MILIVAHAFRLAGYLEELNGINHVAYQLYHAH
jgi:hypothetical protein